VVVIPKEHEDQVLAVAEEIEAAENHIREAARSGVRLDEARKRVKYHQLQTRETP
jgi:regulator of RNase E activity RraA